MQTQLAGLACVWATIDNFYCLRGPDKVSSGCIQRRHLYCIRYLDTRYISTVLAALGLGRVIYRYIASIQLVLALNHSSDKGRATTIVFYPPYGEGY